MLPEPRTSDKEQDIALKNKERRLSRISLKLTGWRGTTAVNISVVAIVLAINLTFLVSVRMKYGSNDGQGIIYEGDCHITGRITIASHLFINIIGSLLLSGSNYTMQVLLSPSREEVDKAHENRRWLEIGTHSLRNFIHVNKARSILWTILALSSVPFHLM